MTNVMIEAKCNFCKETIKFEENDILFFFFFLICLVMMILKGFFTNAKNVVGKITLNCY